MNYAYEYQKLIERLKETKHSTDELLYVKNRTMQMINGVEDDLSQKLDLYPELKLLETVIDKIKSQFINKLYECMKFEVPTETEQIDIITEKIMCDTEEILDEYSLAMAKYRNKVNDFLVDKDNEREINTTSKSVIKLYNPIENYDINYDIDKAIKDIDKTSRKNSVQKSDKEKLFSIKNDLVKSKSINDFAQVIVLLFEYRLLKLEIGYLERLFNELYSHYYAAYIVYADYINQHRKKKIKIFPKEKKEFESIERLEDEIRSIGQALIHNQLESY